MKLSLLFTYCESCFPLITDCESSGDFQSITHDVISTSRRRSKRSAIDNQYSYTEDKLHAAVLEKQQDVSEKARARLIREGSEQRIEGLEDTIDMMSETIKSLQEKVSMIVSVLLADIKVFCLVTQ